MEEQGEDIPGRWTASACLRQEVGRLREGLQSRMHLMELKSGRELQGRESGNSLRWELA